MLRLRTTEIAYTKDQTKTLDKFELTVFVQDFLRAEAPV